MNHPDQTTLRIHAWGRGLQAAGFAANSRYKIPFDDGHAHLFVDDYSDETRAVITADRLDEALAAADHIVVMSGDGRFDFGSGHIDRWAAARHLHMTEASVYGGGVLTQAASTLGFGPIFANEANDDFATIYDVNHPTASVHVAGPRDIKWAKMGDHNPGLLTMTAARDPYVCLRSACTLNPHTIIIEGPQDHLGTSSARVVQKILALMGYSVASRLFDPAEYGEITGCRRSVIAATMHADVQWPAPQRTTRTLGDILEDANSPGLRWLDPWEQMARVDATSTWVPQDNPVVCQHGRYRWLTLDELKRLYGLPDGYHLGRTRATAGEVFVRGSVVGMTSRIIASVTRVAASQASSPPAAPGPGRGRSTIQF